jgi:hypothetical protein
MIAWSPLAGVLYGAAGVLIMRLPAGRVGPLAVAGATAALWTLLARDRARFNVWAALGLLAWRWLALACLAAPLAVLVAAQTVPRAAGVALAYTCRPLDYRQTDSLRWPGALAALLVAVGSAIPSGARLGWFSLSCAVVLTGVTRQWAQSTAGAAGARHRLWLERILECVILTTAACERCRW